LRDDALEHFVDDGREDALVVIGAEGAVDLGQGINSGSGQDTACDVDHLQVFGAGQGGNVAGFGADVVGDRGLEPGYAEMSAWVIDQYPVRVIWHCWVIMYLRGRFLAARLLCEYT